MNKLLLLALFSLPLSASAFLWQDPPKPDAVAFCQSDNDALEETYCACPSANDGDLCRSDEPLPNFCKKSCGHAKSCSCCPVHK